jgi:hypothetical protein
MPTTGAVSCWETDEIVALTVGVVMARAGAPAAVNPLSTVVTAIAVTTTFRRTPRRARVVVPCTLLYSLRSTHLEAIQPGIGIQERLVEGIGCLVSPSPCDQGKRA